MLGDKTLDFYGLAHLRACGPCSLGSIARYFREQVPGIETDQAATEAANHWTMSAHVRGLIEWVQYAWDVV